MKEPIYIDKVKIQLLEKGIVENMFFGGKVIEAEDIRALRQANLSIFGKQPYTVLVEADDQLINFSKEARELVASKEFVGITRAKALVVRGLGQRIIANFYLRVNKPHIKTKLFSDRNKAIDWLRSELNR